MAGGLACLCEAKIAVSSDTGFERSREDAAHDYASSTPPGSFPAKLLALLLARYRETGRPLLFLPTESVSGNGRRLAEVVSTLAEESRQSDSFRDWLGRSVIFADTMVDRIVSECSSVSINITRLVILSSDDEPYAQTGL